MRTGAKIALAAALAAGGGGAAWYLLMKSKCEKEGGTWKGLKCIKGEEGAPARPGQPTVVSTEVTGPYTASVTVSWSRVEGASYYKVYVNGNEVLSNVNTTTATITGLIPGQSYQIAVAACK